MAIINLELRIRDGLLSGGGLPSGEPFGVPAFAGIVVQGAGFSPSH